MGSYQHLAIIEALLCIAATIGNQTTLAVIAACAAFITTLISAWCD